MKFVKAICLSVGVVSKWTAKIGMWAVVLLVLTVSFEVLMRYVFNAPTTWTFDVSYMLLSVFVALGFAYVLCQKGHVRVDVLYNKFSPRAKLIIDIAFTLTMFLPLFFMLTIVFTRDAWYAFQVHERTNVTSWYPPTWPYKSAVALGIAVFFLQGIGTFLHDTMSLVKGGKEPW